MKFDQCKICGSTFSDNQIAGGLFTRHLKSEHDMSKRSYVVEVKYDGTPPKCACGYCDRVPDFYRGDFRKYASTKHTTHDWQKEKFIEENGVPTCANEGCGNEVRWNRGEPTKYCSQTCVGEHVGPFSRDEIQERIKRTCLERYGVDNPSLLDRIKRKISEKRKGNDPFANKTEEEMEKIREKMSNAAQKLWQDPDYYESVLSSMAENLNDPTKMSEPHKRFRRELSLGGRGFVSEQRVGRYVVDEICEERNVIIEVFGDYVHANPEEYDAKDEIVLLGDSYKAREKWEHDEDKINWLKEQGYRVIVLWSSDTIEEAREKLNQC